MLRTLGASRRQILTLGPGRSGGDRAARRALVGIARRLRWSRWLLNALFEAIGVDLPTTGLVLESRTVIVALLVGVLVTFVSSLIPALRSTRVPPIAALHAFTPAPSGAGALALPAPSRPSSASPAWRWS